MWRFSFLFARFLTSTSGVLRITFVFVIIFSRWEGVIAR